MLIRLLIYIILGIVLYRAARSWFGRAENSVASGKVTSAEQVDDVMIKDPVCGTYFPQGKALTLNENGQALYFCSTECRDRYLTEKS
jgi:uncharacterized protein